MSEEKTPTKGKQKSKATLVSALPLLPYLNIGSRHLITEEDSSGLVDMLEEDRNLAQPSEAELPALTL